MALALQRDRHMGPGFRPRLERITASQSHSPIMLLLRDLSGNETNYTNYIRYAGAIRATTKTIVSVASSPGFGRGYCFSTMGHGMLTAC